METLCGLDCNECGYKGRCGGCVATDGKPFGGTCVVGLCCKAGKCPNCGQVFSKECRLMQAALDEFNSLGIYGMEKIDSLNLLVGSDINLQFNLPGGQIVKFWDDKRVYLGTQIKKRGSDRYYGLVADEKYLLVCEYGDNGADAAIIIFTKRRCVNENTDDSYGA